MLSRSEFFFKHHCIVSTSLLISEFVLLKSLSKDFCLLTFALTDLTPDSLYSKVSFGFTNVIDEPSKALYYVARAIALSKDFG